MMFCTQTEFTKEENKYRYVCMRGIAGKKLPGRRSPEKSLRKKAPGKNPLGESKGILVILILFAAT